MATFQIVCSGYPIQTLHYEYTIAVSLLWSTSNCGMTICCTCWHCMYKKRTTDVRDWSANSTL
ncbi:hypothetical protein SISSUDRAFT_1042256 [Sistotremastrum suecicum HHB10207 ss-3]|uniref:Uncharacterized protein n=1 Tax=Sistotremastrum suecicum HHB10207 ss-3 TaxID=1314776 RepID=A0A166GKJ4_9AGAM|nr:hypothetical protein SISSUDRAFT_1042256 [Sistotremastrum suecicum HHB10207 ss-3]